MAYSGQTLTTSGVGPVASATDYTNMLAPKKTPVSTPAVASVSAPAVNSSSTVDISSFTPEQKALFQNAASLAVKPLTVIDNSPISTANLATPAPVITPPAPTYTPTYPSVEDIYNKFNTQNTQLQNQQNDLMSNIQSLYQDIGGEGARRISLEEEQGIATKQKQLDEINARINEMTAQAKQAEVTAEGRQIPTFAITGEQAQINRQLSASTFGLAAQAAALSNQVSRAQDYVNKAIEAEFGIKEKQLEYQKYLLDINRENMSADERKRADAIKIALDERSRVLEEQKSEKNGIYEVMTVAAQNGADNATLEKIRNSTTREQALQLAGQYVVETPDVWSDPYMMGGDYVQRNQKTGEIRTAVNVGTSTGVGDLTSKQYTALNQITTRYQADSIINQAIKGSTAVDIADQVISNPNAATSQLKSLYVLVKNLDPESAVREGELALANQTQSYLQQFSNTFARLTEGRVVSPDAAVALAKATKELMSAWNNTATKRTTQYQSQANTLNIGDAFNVYLTGSGVGFGNTTGQTESEDEQKFNEVIQNTESSGSYLGNLWNALLGK